MQQHWLIANICVGELLPNRFGDECILPTARQPKYLHDSKAAAEEEALRLHKKFGGPGSSFVVFEAVAHTEERRPFEIAASAVVVLEPLPHQTVRIPERPAKRKRAK